MTEPVNNIPIRKKRKKSKKSFGYLYLFAFVFLGALAGLSYIVKSYSPDIDVAIGNNEALTLSDSDMEVEIKSVDERLKWIQMEDEMPTVALRDTENNSKKDKDKSLKEEDKIDKQNPDEVKKEKKPPVPAFSEIPVKKPDFRTSYSAKNMSNVIPSPVPSVTKVYLGNYASIEEAMAVQSKISSEEPDLNPFIKAIRDKYVVQLGSFSDPEKASALVVKLRQRGYSPKINHEN